ncbi:MAG: DEAD/DEAH box helicase [Levilactobacillus sp.]|jgi:ATP-dependent RNA helicase CshB|uniref:DEAD-box ATP-dependent RNA helicase CshB n=1 Tax=Levilactobacillus suantsaiihabitans TaxID=2487722 RepID=A0A4Z0JA91_9LACO|nr:MULTISPECIES: DEAD/DEAH box helicase [Levilactobacillus]MCH4124274.1 DEAD/DEAH box helicase [Levilactobacillus sp.]MCI1554293.1 DEAD/DEAH box helicase [Levilactobacillus sp.]MCI1599419.1 DEAD/DEAH box helicase [Levilactobacillus sp.]TGD19269.1 DEAD/DEAH box helicase [Levilactobacillus suantsaiihabitans]
MTADFKEFKLQPYIMTALHKIGFTKPTKVQEKLIPVIAAGKDVVGQSQTGSGKTHTFLLPIFNQLTSDNQVQAVITTPSRELAYQIHTAAEQLAAEAPFEIRIGNYVGGTDKKRQVEKLHHFQPQLVIGTPGRVMDLIQSDALDVHTARQFVVDEADMTLDLGFLDQVDRIAGRMPKDLQMMVFSATIPQRLNPFLQKYMNHPVREEIPTDTIISDTIDNWLISTKGQNRNQLIYQLITMGEPYLVLIFANTKTRVEQIHDFLQAQGMKVAMIHGGIKPRERKRVMREVKNLQYQFVVATDLAARGIDIEGVSHVINDDIPEDLDFFVHRVGRTGRQGMHGTAITLYSPDEEAKVAEIEAMGIKFQPKRISNNEIVDSYDRNRRTKRNKSTEKLDPGLIGYVKKKKKKIKPGYKHQIKQEIHRRKDQERRIAQRQSARNERKRRKRESERYQ